MIIKSLLDLMKIVEKMYDYLQGKIEFDENQYPIFKNSHFLQEYPEMIVPYDHRNDKKVKNKSKTLICFFDSDIRNYSRMNKVFENIKEYKKYLGVASMDITVTEDMDIELQELIIYANVMFMAVLAVNNIKVVFNTRNGTNDTLKIFNFLPKNITCISGFLGCKKAMSYKMSNMYLDKILFLLPRKILIYGKKDININERLDIMGIEYRYYVDFHQLSKRRKANERL